MNYKYKKWQIFGKRLNIPKKVLNDVYYSKLSYDNFIKYNLDDKIPITCLEERDRKIVEKIGLNKSKTLDWQLIKKFWLEDYVITINLETNDINMILYEHVRDTLSPSPSNYSDGMRKAYLNKLFDESKKYDERTQNLIKKYNNGTLDIVELISNWELFKDKEIKFLIRDYELNTFKHWMEDYRDILQFYDDLLKELSSCNNRVEEENVIQEYTNFVLKYSITKDVTGTYSVATDMQQDMKNQKLKVCLKYAFQNFFEMVNPYYTNNLIEELKKIPRDYIVNNKISFDLFLNNEFLKFANTFGLKNIVDFDNECGHFFTKNNCEILKSKAINLLNTYSINYGSSIQPGQFTKDQFYETIKKMIIYDPIRTEIATTKTNYGDITGEFRTRYPELFISENAPKELKNALYNRTITSDFILSNPTYIEYLKDVDIETTYKNMILTVIDNGHEYKSNLENLIKEKFGQDSFNIMLKYGRYLEKKYFPGNKINHDCSKGEMLDKFDEFIYSTIISGAKYDENIYESFKKKYPSLFLSEDAPEELKKAFYSRNVNLEYVLTHPTYQKYLSKVDPEMIFINYNYQDGDIITKMKTVMGNEETFNILTLYLKHLSSRRIKDELSDINLKSKEDILNEFDRIILEEIIEKNQKYNENFPNHFKENNPTLFLSKDAPEELKNALYNRTININFVLENQSYHEYLKNINPSLIIGALKCQLYSSNYYIGIVNIFDIIKQKFGEDTFEIMITYGKALSLANHRYDFLPDICDDCSKDTLLDKLDEYILERITDKYGIKYDESFPLHFKKNNPTLFLNENVSQDIKDKFYNRKLTIEDFNTNPKLLKIFDNTNVTCGFTQEVSFMIPLFNNVEDTKIANYNRLKVISQYLNMSDKSLQVPFADYIKKYGKSLEIKKVESIYEVLSHLVFSNSSEVFALRYPLAHEVLKTENPEKTLNQIEDIFIRNNIPTPGKRYLISQIVDEDFHSLNAEYLNSESSTTSPVLKKSSTKVRNLIVFSDLIKASFGSNNRSVNEYLKNIEIGSNLYEQIKSGKIEYGKINEEQEKVLIKFSKYLTTLYNNSIKSKKDNKKFTPTNNAFNDISELSKKILPSKDNSHSIGDMTVKMFCGYTGIDTLEDAKSYINQKIKKADIRNRIASNSDMKLNEDVFIKGIGDINFFNNILQNGNLCKEFLGADYGMDNTPLDADVSRISGSNEETVEQIINKTAAGNYGPIYLVLKNDDRFIVTREQSKILSAKRDMSKLEAFYTGLLGSDHYGIRTGFASSDINYVVMTDYDDRVGLEIAMNGFYIPVANMEGKIVFTQQDYDKLRGKMAGLSYYDEKEYKFSANLVTPETKKIAEHLDENSHEIKYKITKINEIVSKSLAELDLKLKTDITEDLTDGIVEFINTGSTGRGTNIPGDGDFDFIMRLDKRLIYNAEKMNKLKETLSKNIGKGSQNSFGDFRLSEVSLDNSTNVDIDISFVQKQDTLSYSSDMSIKDRLSNIKKSDPDKYKYVLANIILAKKVLKEANAYKPNRGYIPQGGLGGIGIENWVLQNGGSFNDAATNFLAVAEGKNFDEFKSAYKIWDFGDNFFASKEGSYPHDNFVENNMTKDGYERMCCALKKYLSLTKENIDINIK